jgi:Zn-dependent oligopeptidase
MRLVKSKNFLSHINAYILLNDANKIEEAVNKQLVISSKHILHYKALFQQRSSSNVSKQLENSCCRRWLFDSIVLPLSIDESNILTMTNTFRALSLLHPDSTVRKASSIANRRLEEYKLDLFCDIDLYSMLCVIKDTEWISLSPIEQRLLSRMMRDFERNGMQVEDAATREEILKKKKLISQLQIEFNKNLIEDKTQLLFSVEELTGLPEEYINGLPRTEDGKCIVTLKPSEIYPIQTSAELNHVRELVENTIARKCQELNTPIAEKIIALRTECAQLMGYKSHADYILNIRMAKDVSTVWSFLESLREKVTPIARKELSMLLKLKKQHCKRTNQPFDEKINAWDVEFFRNLAAKEICERDDGLIRQYFPLNQTFQKILSLFGEMFGMQFEEITQQHANKLWHEDVRLFAVYNTLNGMPEEIMGYLFLDIFSRTGKYMTNACFNIQGHFKKEDGTYQLPAACIVLNFTKPSRSQEKLLKHHELKSLLHEFGHFCHNVCSKSPFGRFSCTQVEKDFAEFPSQLLENWCWNADILKILSSHYKTGGPIPDNLVHSILKAKNLYISHQILSRLHLSMYDIMVHSEPDVQNLPPNYTMELYSDLKKEVCLVSVPEGSNPSASFGHIMRTYDSGYYSYLWSQVYSCDAFTRFVENNALVGRSQVSLDYRKTILERGGTHDGMDMLEEFLRRSPSQTAFLQSYQLCK